MIMLVREFKSDNESVENCNKGIERKVLVLLTLSRGENCSIFYCFVVTKYRAFIEVVSGIWKRITNKQNKRNNVNETRAKKPSVHKGKVIKSGE